jgi:protein-S-isoprenylcysteine O-methyltransferase Ste14
MSVSEAPSLSPDGKIKVAIAILERVVLVAIAIPYVVAIYRSLPSHPSFILVATSEILAAFLVLIQRRGEVAVRAYPIAIACAGTLATLLVRPGGYPVLPESVGSILMASGLALAVWSKVALNRSFGLVAANRGVKKWGPYRFVRHPMYLGYVLAQIGFLSQNLRLLNLFLYAAGWTLQLLRIREEERILVRDPVYAAYRSDVRWKLFPGLV